MVKVFCSRRIKMITFVALISVISLALLFGKGVNAQSSFKCTDSDGGKDYFVKGEVNFDDRDHYRDTCLGYTIVEYFCEQKANQVSVGGEEKSCESGCRNGACLGTPKEKPKPTCTDSDGGNDHYVKGFTNGVGLSGQFLYADICGQGTDIIPKGNHLMEWNCGSNSQALNENFNCPNGCKDGACVKEPEYTCTDSDDGRNYSVKGETADFGDTRKDSCFDANTLTEFYCEQAEGQTRPSRGAEQVNCEYGCKDGVCVEAPSEEDIDRIEQQKQIQKLLTGIGGMSGMLRGVNVMEKTFQQFEKQGIATPSDLAQTIARVKEINPEITKFKNKKTEDVTDEEAGTLTDNMSELCEIGPTLDEWGNQIPQFLRLGAKMKQTAKDLKRAKSDVKLAVKAAARSKFGISDKVDELNGAVEALETTLSDVIASTDFDEKDGKINEFYNQFRGIYDTIGVINALQNTAKAKAEWGKRAKANASTISQLSKNTELDVTELVTKNDEVTAKLDELNVALAKKPIDRDEIRWIFEDLKSRQAEFIDITDQLRGVNSALPRVQVSKFDASSFKNLSAFSQFCGVSESSDNSEAEVPSNE